MHQQPIPAVEPPTVASLSLDENPIAHPVRHPDLSSVDEDSKFKGPLQGACTRITWHLQRMSLLRVDEHGNLRAAEGCRGNFRCI